MNWPVVAAVMRKDLKIVARNRGVRIPLLVTPILLLVVVPTFLVLGADLLAQSDIAESGGGQTPFEDFLPSVQETVGDTQLTWEQTALEFLVAPLYLLVPLVVATVIAADSFAGERERRTLEALLHTPTDDEDLFVGKLLTAYLPALAVGLVGFAVYSVLVNVLAYDAVGHIFFPTPMWLALAFWVAPGVSALGISLMVVVSSRVRSLQAAHQIGSLVVLPFVLMIIVQVTGIMLLNVATVIVFGCLLWLGAALLMLIGIQQFDRDKLASRL